MKKLLLLLTLSLSAFGYSQTISGEWLATYELDGTEFTDKMTVTQVGDSWKGAIILQQANVSTVVVMAVYGNQLTETTFTFTLEDGTVNFMKLEEDEKGQFLQQYNESWEPVTTGDHATHFYLVKVD